MLGAMIGDLAGSVYEVEEINYWFQHKKPRPYEERMKIMDPKTPLFLDTSIFTDDTAWTLAIYDAVVNGDCDYENYLKEYGKKELEKGLDKFGRGRFSPASTRWIKGDYQGESYGNGAAMRISPIGFIFDSFEQIKEQACLASIPSHNHEEAIKSAEGVAIAIYLLRIGMPKRQVEDYIKLNYYSMNYELEDLRRNYTFTSKASESVPQAMFCFFHSNSFEDAIRTAISIGGDTDTIASITGALAESYYGIPEQIKESIKNDLDEDTYLLLKDKYFTQKEYKIKKDNVDGQHD